MSWFLAAIYDRFMREAEDAGIGEWRRALLRDVSGEVLELGAGTGANLPYYPEAVRHLILAEPDRHMRARLLRRLAHQSGPDAIRAAEVAPASAGNLPFDDARFDAVVSTLVLCSVDDTARALVEVRRVLRPGGRFVFLEHVASDRPEHFRWQRRIEPLWKRVGGNCHLTRRTEEAIVEAGFCIEWIERESMNKAPTLVRSTVRGVARAPH